MKKNIIALVIASFAVLSACSTPAEEVAVPIENTLSFNNYFVLNRNVEQLKAIGMAAGNLATTDKDSYGEFTVVICGRAVKDLANAETITRFMEILNANHVNVIACGFSLKKFDIDTELLPKNVTIVPNGILYGFELQKDGYFSITL